MTTPYNQFSCGMFIKTVHGEYTWVNDALLKLQRIHRADILGKIDEHLPWSSQRKELCMHDQQVLDEHVPLVFKETIIRRGQVIEGYCHKSPVYDQNGHLTGIAGIFVDMPEPAKFKTSALSIREKQCLKNLAHGLTAKVSAQNLKLSPRTVEGYLEQLRDKLHCKNRAELIAFYYENLHQHL